MTFRVGDAQIKNLNLWANSALPLNGGATAYGTLLYNHRDSNGDAFFREAWDTSSNVAQIYPNGFLPHSKGTNEDWHVNGGVRGQVAGWAYDASLTYGLNSFKYALENSLNASLGPASPTAFNLGGFRFGQVTANLDFSGDVAWLGAANPLTLAYGLELRRENFSDTAGDPASYSTGAFPGTSGSQGDGGLNPLNVSSDSRSIAGLYADLSGNLAKNVFADAAVRFDHYNDAGSATTGKLSARWEFVPNWSLRGAVSNNFRAPALVQEWSSYSPTTYVSGGVLAGVQIVPVTSAPAQALGAQPLKPEKSRNLSLGITAQPVQQLQVTADLFHISIKDRIALSQNLSPTSGGFAGNTYQFFTNAVDTTTRGAEVVASWSARVFGQNLRISDASMWANNQISQIHAQPPQVSALGSGLLFGLQAQNAITTAIPKRRDVVSFSWSGDRSANSWNLLARVTHTGEVTRVFDFGGGFVPTQTYGATAQLDLEGEYQITRDLAVALGSQNVTNRYPTQSSSDINYYGNLPYDYLSPIGFNGRYVYARLRYDLR